MADKIPDPAKLGIEPSEMVSGDKFFGLVSVVRRFREVASAWQKGQTSAKTSEAKVREEIASQTNKYTTAAKEAVDAFSTALTKLYSDLVTEHPLAVLYLPPVLERTEERMQAETDRIVFEEIQSRRNRKVAVPVDDNILDVLNGLSALSEVSFNQIVMSDALPGYGLFTLLKEAAEQDELADDVVEKMDAEEKERYELLRSLSDVIYFSDGDKRKEWKPNIRLPQGIKKMAPGSRGRSKSLAHSTYRFVVNGKTLPEGTTPYRVAQLLSGSIPGEVSYSDLVSAVEAASGKKDIAAGETVTVKFGKNTATISRVATSDNSATEETKTEENK